MLRAFECFGSTRPQGNEKRDLFSEKERTATERIKKITQNYIQTKKGFQRVPKERVPEQEINTLITI